jgi:hypothetical protein
MKKIFLATLAVAFCLHQSYAQTRLGVKAGLNVSNATNIGSTYNQTRFGFHGGLFTEIGFSKKIILQPELLYSIKGFKFPGTPYNYGGMLSLRYVSVPLLAGFRATKQFTILLGPEYSFLTKANSKFDGSDHDISKNYRKWDVAIDLGVTINITHRLGAAIRYCYGLNDLANVTLTDPLGNMIADYKTGSNRVFQLALLYQFL